MPADTPFGFILDAPKKDEKATATAKPKPSPILTLPNELLQKIVGHLPVCHQICLRMTNSELHARIPPPFRDTLTTCDRRFLYRKIQQPFQPYCRQCNASYLPLARTNPPRALTIPSMPAGQDLLPPDGPTSIQNISPAAFTDRMQKYFDIGPLPRHPTDPWGGPGEIVATPPHGLCPSHRGRLASVTRAADDPPPAHPVRWLLAARILCLHCGQVRGWRGAQRCECEALCEACGAVPVDAWLRSASRSARGHGRLAGYLLYREDRRRRWGGEGGETGRAARGGERLDPGRPVVEELELREAVRRGWVWCREEWFGDYEWWVEYVPVVLDE